VVDRHYHLPEHRYTGDDLGRDSEWEVLPDDNNEDDNWDGIFGDARLEREEGETEEGFAKREAEGEQIKEGLELYMSKLSLISTAMTDALKYPSAHRYLKAIPKPTAQNFPTILRWAEQVKVEMGARKIPITWSRKRGRVLFRGS
jgi:hypothetical protein